MKEGFIPKRFSRDSKEIIDIANRICADMRNQGYDLTLRQLYYQFVAHHGLPNQQRSYKRLGSIVNDARLAGVMDWSFINDRTRNVAGSYYGFDDPSQFIEVWVEKDALVNVVARACEDSRVPYFSCRGYVSQSEMYSAAKRFERRRNAGLTPVIIHLGDHDPSGIDMSRDIEERLSLMSWGPIEVRRIALNMDQVDQYQPPPNPTKFTDSRAADYVQQYGYESWELDALEPRVLTALIQDEIEPLIDRDTMSDRVDHERRQIERMREIADHWHELDDQWDQVMDFMGLS
jgi:hypothetical protein